MPAASAPLGCKLTKPSDTVAIAIVCKTPEAGRSKTRLSPPLRAEECAAISSCFIRDLSATIADVAKDDDATGYALYTPVGSEATLWPLLPEGFLILPQQGEDFGDRLMFGARDLLARHKGAILVNSDSPTLPASILRAAVDALLEGDVVVMSPADDGGYTLIGLSALHVELFKDMPWSTPAVHHMTQARAEQIGLRVVNVPGWYDVDDEASLKVLTDEFAGRQRGAGGEPGAHAPATRAFLKARDRAADHASERIPQRTPERTAERTPDHPHD